MKFEIQRLIAARDILRRSSSQLGDDAYETSCDHNCLGVNSDPSHLDFSLEDLGINCGKGYICHSFLQLGENSCNLNCWGWLEILAISTFLYDLSFSHVGLLWIIHGSVLCLHFTDDQVRSCLTTIEEVLDTHLGYESTWEPFIIFSLVLLWLVDSINLISTKGSTSTGEFSWFRFVS